MNQNDTTPQNPECEKNILGAIMQNGDFFQRCRAAGVTEDDFFTPLHRDLYRAIEKTGKTAMVQLAAMFPGHEEAIGSIFISVVTTARFSDWLRELQEQGERRRTIAAARKIIEQARQPQTVFRDAIAAFRQYTAEAQARLAGDETRSLPELIAEYTANLEAGKFPERIPYNMPLDRALYHLRREIVALGAAPGAGKTTFCIQLLVNLIARRYRPAMFCGEMPVQQLFDRLISNLAQIPLGEIRAIQHRAQCKEQLAGLRAMAEKQLFQLRGAGDYRHSAAGIREELRRYRDEAGRVDMVMIDYLQNLSTPAGMRAADVRQAVDANLEAIREMAAEFDCAILLLSQLNRESLRGGKLDGSALKESAHIAEVASALVLMNPPESCPNDAPREIGCQIAKNRNGRIGNIAMTMHPEICSFDTGTVPQSDAPDTEGGYHAN